MSTSPADGPGSHAGSRSDGSAATGSDPYQLLQVPSSATTEDLRRAFRRLSKQVHPDTTSLPAAEAQDAFLRLRQAYALLSDPERRRVYDEGRRLAVPVRPGTGAASGVDAAQAARAAGPAGSPRPASVRRALSGGEWFALVLLAIALALSLLLGIGVAWARGVELVRQPSWWSPQAPNTAPVPAPAPAPANAEAPATMAAPPTDRSSDSRPS